MSGKYDDILHLPHHVSTKHPQMAMQARAAQFSPFAALTGYGEIIRETRRQTSVRMELDETVKEEIQRRLQIVRDHLGMHPEFHFRYFVPDEKKEGSAYVTASGSVKRLDGDAREIVLDNGRRIPIDEIIDIQGEVLCQMKER